MPRAQLYRYFHSKMLKVRVFRDDSCSLFLELKQHVQVFTNQLAGKCNARFQDLIAEPCGPDLCRFVFAPGKGIIRDSPLPLRSKGFDWLAGRSLDEVAPGEEAILRQDDPRVCAVLTGPHDELEREMECTIPKQLLHLNEFGVRMHYSEAVQVAQLHRRALLLDRAFKAKVIEALTFQLPLNGIEEAEEEDTCDVGALEQPINAHRKQSISEHLSISTCPVGPFTPHRLSPPSPPASASTHAINATMGEASGAFPKADASQAATVEGARAFQSAGGGLPVGGGEGGGGGDKRAARVPCCGVALLWVNKEEGNKEEMPSAVQLPAHRNGRDGSLRFPHRRGSFRSKLLLERVLLLECVTRMFSLTRMCPLSRICSLARMCSY
jgi:hypothetical protein